MGCFRATIESHKGLRGEALPPVNVTIANNEVDFIINTPSGQAPRQDEVKIRSTAVANHIPVLTNLRAAEASILAIRSLQRSVMAVQTLQEYHQSPDLAPT